MSAPAPWYCQARCRLYKRHRKAEKARQPRVRVKPMMETIAQHKARGRYFGQMVTP